MPTPASCSVLTPTTGDARLLDSARQEARKGFENSHVWSADSKEAIAGIAHAEEVARMLRHNIVQGQHAGEQSYSEASELLIEGRC